MVKCPNMELFNDGKRAALPASGGQALTRADQGPLDFRIADRHRLLIRHAARIRVARTPAMLQLARAILTKWSIRIEVADGLAGIFKILALPAAIVPPRLDGARARAQNKYQAGGKDRQDDKPARQFNKVFEH